MDEVLRRVTRQDAAAALISPQERENAVQVMLEFLAWLEKSKDLTLCQAFKPQFDWYMPSSANKERLAHEFLGNGVPAVFTQLETGQPT